MSLGQRIKERRKELGLTQEELARHFGISREAVQQWEKEDSPTKPKGERLTELARLLEADVQWLLAGSESVKPEDLRRRERPRQSSGMLTIDELDVLGANAESGGAVHPSEGLHYDHEKVVVRWQVPAQMVRAHTASSAERIKIITAKGLSNAPLIMPGDKLMVDLDDRTPSPPGFFAIWDGVGELVKQLEVVAYADPPRVILKSTNRDLSIENRELSLSEVSINGRVIGKWMWT
jgi:transcriptional regulator with XRE-family HTH domain